MLPAPYRGINAHPMWMADANIDLFLQTLASSRLQLIRIDMPLNWLLQQGPTTLYAGYRERLDRFVHGCPSSIEILCTAGYTPRWAGAHPGTDPTQFNNDPWTDPSAYGAAIGMLAGLYPQIAAWEILNEPDLDYSVAWASGTVEQRAATYVRMLEAAYPAIKAANPNAKVVAPATSGLTSGPWLQGFYQASPKGAYDVLSAHVYGDPPSHGTYTPHDLVQAWCADIWPISVTNGDGRTPLWMTEFGWTTGTGGVTIAQQAANLAQTVVELDAQAPQVRRVYPYAAFDDALGGAAAKTYGIIGDALMAVKGDGSAWTALNTLP